MSKKTIAEMACEIVALKSVGKGYNAYPEVKRHFSFENMDFVEAEIIEYLKKEGYRDFCEILSLTRELYIYIANQHRIWLPDSVKTSICDYYFSEKQSCIICETPAINGKPYTECVKAGKKPTGKFNDYVFICRGERPEINMFVKAASPRRQSMEINRR